MTTDQALGHERLLKEFNVSRETLEKLTEYVRLLKSWQKSINLVSSNTLETAWVRHIIDSAQLIRHIPDNAKTFLDIGSGAGFPALVLAVLKAQTDVATRFILVESSGKKTAFLRRVAQELSLTGIEVRNERIETALATVSGVDVITARALAPLTDLIHFVDPLLKTGAIALFPKGRDVDRELTIASERWHFFSGSYPSITDTEAQILKIWI